MVNSMSDYKLLVSMNCTEKDHFLGLEKCTLNALHVRVETKKQE